MGSSSSSGPPAGRGGKPSEGSDPLWGVDVAELVRDAQRGDVLAMSRLLDVLTPYVGRICGAVALQAGEGAAQEELLCVFRQLRSLPGPNALYAWVGKTAVREAPRAGLGGGRPGSAA